MDNEAGQSRGLSIAGIGQPTVQPVQMSSTENRRSRDQYKCGDSQNRGKSLSSLHGTKHEFWHSGNDVNLVNWRPKSNISNINGAMQVQCPGSSYGESSFSEGPISAREGFTAFMLPHLVHERQPLAIVNQHPTNFMGGAKRGLRKPQHFRYF